MKVSEAVDCLITDWRMPQLSGLEFIGRASAIRSETPIIVITAFGDVETAVSAMRSGAFDFITKPFDRQAILITVEKALKFGAILAENRRLRRLIHEDFRLENVIERMVVLSDGEKLTIADVPENIKNLQTTSENLWFSLPAEPFDLEKVECEIIREALKRFDNNQSQTARYLGITRSALIYRMQKFNLGGDEK